MNMFKKRSIRVTLCFLVAVLTILAMMPSATFAEETVTDGQCTTQVEEPAETVQPETPAEEATDAAVEESAETEPEVTTEEAAEPTAKVQRKTSRAITPNGKAVQEGLPVVKLEGDLLGDGDTGHDTLKVVHRGDHLRLTGQINVNKVKDQITQTYKNVFNSEPNDDIMKNIELSDLDSGFNLVITLDDGLSLDNPEVLGSNLGIFRYEDPVINNGNQITIHMPLKDEYSTFKDLYYAVQGTDELYSIDLNVLVDKDAPLDKILRIKGGVEGEFSANASYYYQKMPFKF